MPCTHARRCTVRGLMRAVSVLKRVHRSGDGGERKWRRTWEVSVAYKCLGAAVPAVCLRTALVACACHDNQVKGAAVVAADGAKAQLGRTAVWAGATEIILNDGARAARRMKVELDRILRAVHLPGRRARRRCRRRRGGRQRRGRRGRRAWKTRPDRVSIVSTSGIDAALVAQLQPARRTRVVRLVVGRTAHTPQDRMPRDAATLIVAANVPTAHGRGRRACTPSNPIECSRARYATRVTPAGYPDRGRELHDAIPVVQAECGRRSPLPCTLVVEDQAEDEAADVRSPRREHRRGDPPYLAIAVCYERRSRANVRAVDAHEERDGERGVGERDGRAHTRRGNGGAAFEYHGSDCTAHVIAREGEGCGEGDDAAAVKIEGGEVAARATPRRVHHQREDALARVWPKWHGRRSGGHST